MAETKNDRFVRMFLFLNEQKIIKKFIINFKQRKPLEIMGRFEWGDFSKTLK
jgi:hypothetical protein